MLQTFLVGNKIENLLGPLKMCRCDVVLYCYSIAVLQCFLLSSNIVILYIFDLQCNSATVLLGCLAMVLQW